MSVRAGRGRSAMLFPLLLLLTACAGVPRAAPGAQIAVQPSHSDAYPMLFYRPFAPPPDAGYPLIIFLHGSGERGSDLNLVRVHGPPRLLHEGRALPFVVASPQLESDGDWSVDRLDATLALVRRMTPVDPRRIILTGLSRGGHASWRWAAARPHFFAAVVPVAGRGDPATGCAFGNTPVRAFHGSEDSVVDPSGSTAMVAAIRACGGTGADVTVYPATGHDSWTRTYADAALYDWMAAQRRDGE